MKLKYKVNLKEREQVMKLLTGLDSNSSLNISKITGFTIPKINSLIDSYYEEKMANKLEVQFEIV